MSILEGLVPRLVPRGGWAKMKQLPDFEGVALSGADRDRRE